MLEIKELSAGYGDIDIIRNISFTAQRGESLCILGPNGSGKSTLLKAIARIIDYRGNIALGGSDFATLSRKELAQKIAMMGQNVRIFFPYTVSQCITLGRYAHSKGLMNTLSAEDKTIIEDTMKILDIWDIRRCMIDELSGGQIQRVFLAMTLAQNPEVILLDEPTSHLDLKYQIDLLNFLKSWVKENNKTLIGVFHDLNMALRFSDTAIVLDNGAIASAGKIEDVLNSKALDAVYGMDVRAFMRESLGKWE